MGKTRRPARSARPARYYVRLRDGSWLASARVPYSWTKREAGRLAFHTRDEAEVLCAIVRAPWNGAEVVEE